MRYLDASSLLADVLTDEETPETLRLIGELRVARRRGYLTRREFLTICRWKSPRSLPLCRKNAPARIRRQTALAFASRSERVRFEALTALRGVGAPTASALLTLTDPRRYGVIDVRVWKLLFELGSVRSKPGGAGFRFEHWHQYVTQLRGHAKALGVTVRAVELSLFLYHQRVCRGPLYTSGRGVTGRRAFAPP
jgi:hypothetical protein